MCIAIVLRGTHLVDLRVVTTRNKLTSTYVECWFGRLKKYILCWISSVVQFFKFYGSITRGKVTGGSLDVRGGPKNSRNFKKKIYLKYLYKFENLVPFKVLPLRLYAAIPAPLPTEMLSRATSDSLAALDSIAVEDFRQFFQHWERCWDCCIQSQGGVLQRGLNFQTCTKYFK
jgi:hypothetical protein